MNESQEFSNKPKWHSVCGRCTGFTELSENDDVSFPFCCCLYLFFFLFVGSSVDASILQGVARSCHLLQRCGCIIDGGFFRLMLEGQENKKPYPHPRWWIVKSFRKSKGTGPQTNNSPLPGTWWPSVYKWLFQLDDEPKVVGNHHFHPFKTGCLGYPGSNLMAIPPVPRPGTPGCPPWQDGLGRATRWRRVIDLLGRRGLGLAGRFLVEDMEAMQMQGIYVYIYIYIYHIYIYIPTLYMISSIYRFEDWDLDIYTSDMPQCHAYLTYLYQDYHSCFFWW